MVGLERAVAVAAATAAVTDIHCQVARTERSDQWTLLSSERGSTWSACLVVARWCQHARGHRLAGRRSRALTMEPEVPRTPATALSARFRQSQAHPARWQLWPLTQCE